MPTTASDLAQVGLRDIPAWWIATVSGTTAHYHHHPLQTLPLPHDNNNTSATGGQIRGYPGGGIVGFDPRDVRATVMHHQQQQQHLHHHPIPQQPAATTAAVPMGVSSTAPVPRSGERKKAVRALLRELGLGPGQQQQKKQQRHHYYAGKARKSEMSPLEKGKRKAEKEALLKAARADMASAAAGATAPSVSAAAAGAEVGAGTGEGGVAGQQGQVKVVEAVEGKGAEDGGKDVGKGPVGTAAAAQEVVAQKMGKLVDV